MLKLLGYSIPKAYPNEEILNPKTKNYYFLYTDGYKLEITKVKATKKPNGAISLKKAKELYEELIPIIAKNQSK